MRHTQCINNRGPTISCRAFICKQKGQRSLRMEPAPATPNSKQDKLVANAAVHMHFSLLFPLGARCKTQSLRLRAFVIPLNQRLLPSAALHLKENNPRSSRDPVQLSKEVKLECCNV